MKRIYTTMSPAQADFLMMVLRDEGIEAVLENEQGARHLEIVPIIPLVISVRDEDVPKASEVLRNALAKKPAAPVDEFVSITCRGCGRGLEATAEVAAELECPYCGKQAAPAS